SFREFRLKYRQGLSRPPQTTLCLEWKGPFPCEKPKEDEVLCLLTGNSRVRIERVAPRMRLELLTIWLTHLLKKGVFSRVFHLAKGPPGASAWTSRPLTLR